MNVIINPSGQSGKSFKGLHAYLSHDPEQARTSDRVDWIESRNLGTDNPSRAYKIMVATAKAQHDLKRAAGIKAGRPAKDGPVMHVVLAFDQDEPSSREAMIDAADEYLASLGVDPAKMRAKNKPKRRQFANEHQVMMYAHNDTGKHHIHLMINKVHPEHGLMLPSNNERRKSSEWALAYSKRHGTDHKTPAREENLNARKAGKKIEPTRRKSRNAYEIEKLPAANDNDRFGPFKAEQREKDAALALRGRNMAKQHTAARIKLAEAHQTRMASLGDKLKRDIHRAEAQTFEAFRIPRRELYKRQRAERQTFDALETSFFGRVGSGFKTIRLTKDAVREDTSGIIHRTFKILTNAGARRDYFDKSQSAARAALVRQEAKRVDEATKALKLVQASKQADLRGHFLGERTHLLKSQAVEVNALKQDWKTRTAERQAAMNEVKAAIKQREAERAKLPTLTAAERSLFEEYRQQFNDAGRDCGRDRGKDRDRER